jgi:23S rRNA C2498 (ribose-2'-O)-methylase RlmM
MKDLVASLPDNKARTVISLYRQTVSDDVVCRTYEKDGGVYVYAIFGGGEHNTNDPTRSAFVVKEGVLTAIPKQEWEDALDMGLAPGNHLICPKMLFIPYELIGQFLEAMDKLVQAYK